MAYVLQFDQTGVNPDVAIIHDNESFHVQWKAVNLGPDESLWTASSSRPFPKVALVTIGFNTLSFTTARPMGTRRTSRSR